MKNNGRIEFETLHSNKHRIRFLIGFVCVVVLLTVFIIGRSHAKYRVTQSIPLVNGTINYTPYDFKVMAMYQQDDSGEYVEIDAMPSSGYTINEETSYCTLDNVSHDNEAVLYTNDSGEHVIAGLKKNSKCYLYFDVKKVILSGNMAESIIANADPNSNVIVTDDTASQNPRYIGADPNNYVLFNNELWRIIGVFSEDSHGVSGEKLVKIIRSESLGSMAWDNKPSGTGSSTSSNYGSNDWSDSALQVVLNSGSYYNRTSGTCPSGRDGATTNCDFSNIGLTDEAKSIIETVTWKLGGSSTYNDVTPSMFYERERGTTVYSGRPTTWSGKVGLMYPSDYGYATSGGTTTNRESCLATVLYRWNNTDYVSSDCKNNDWLYDSSANQWTLTPGSTNSEVYLVFDTGYVTSGYRTTSSNEVRPTVYLTSNVVISGGDGTSSNPYLLE